MHAGSRILSAASGLLLAFACGAPALADDSEVFTTAAFASGREVRPNILFIVDTSGSMDIPVESYDPSRRYDGDCRQDRLYWRTSNNRAPPDCATTNSWVPANQNRCAASFDTLTGAGGWWRGRVQQHHRVGRRDYEWQNAESGDRGPLECSNDAGEHGPSYGSWDRWASDDRDGWTNRENRAISWYGRQYLSLYSGNYANWWWHGRAQSLRRSRWNIVRDVAKNLADTLEDVNLGLMRYSYDGGDDYDGTAQGGMILHPVAELTGGPAGTRQSIKDLLDDVVVAGNTPLSETYYEAYLYFEGGEVDFGDNSHSWPGTSQKSVAASRVGGTLASTQYESPVEYTCQRNFIVYLTDGLPTADRSAETKIEALPDFGEIGGSCPEVGPNPDSDEESGRCMVSLARYMNGIDFSDPPTGRQNVSTYVVGFGEDIATSKDFLDEVARAGGSDEAYTANDVGDLTAALQEIFAQIREGADSTFTAPTVSVNAFNRARNLNDVFISVFSPSGGLHWPGNLKKYRFVDGELHDANGNPAVDPETGFIVEGARSFWSKDHDGADIVDGPEVTVGGAASRIPPYETGAGNRRLYTHLGAADLRDAANQVVATNERLTETLLGIDGPGDPDRDDVIAFARGEDLTDEDRDGEREERRMRMGDPMHAQPAVVTYGGSEDSPDSVVYLPTNDGYLHAIDADTGVELWAFIPPEFLPRLTQLYLNPTTPGRSYALDGSIRVFKYDSDGDGKVEAADGDKVYLFFGFGRGGSTYYALDVTHRSAPRLKWKRSNADLPGLGKAWSVPAIARVEVKGVAQAQGDFVLIFGGGYDLQQENYDYVTDTVGNRLFMLDLESGRLLWYAGDTADADLELERMNNSIPGDVTVLDVDGDKYADRMYAADTGGRIWRFDIWNGESRSELVSGGMIAALGAGEQATATRTDARRFYYAPDVALIKRRGQQPYYNIAIGSGYRGHPLETDTRDRFYSVRDYLPFGKRTQEGYEDFEPVEDGDLIDITDDVETKVPDGAAGWKLELREHGGWVGEKVLAESVTVNGVILFPTFTPAGPDPVNPCLARTLNHVYAIRVDNGSPYLDYDDDEVLEGEERSTRLNQGGIASEVGVLLEGHPEGHTTCTSGVEVLERCVPVGSTVRTFWHSR